MIEIGQQIYVTYMYVWYKCYGQQYYLHCSSTV